MLALFQLPAVSVQARHSVGPHLANVVRRRAVDGFLYQRIEVVAGIRINPAVDAGGIDQHGVEPVALHETPDRQVQHLRATGAGEPQRVAKVDPRVLATASGCG